MSRHSSSTTSADAVAARLVPGLLRKLGRLSRLGVDDVVNEYSLKKLAYEARVRLFCALLRRADADGFAEAFNASTVALRRRLAAQQGLGKQEVQQLQKEAKARLAQVLTGELAHFNIHLAAARQASQHPLYSKAACYRILDELVDAVIAHLKETQQRRRGGGGGGGGGAGRR